MPCPAAVSAQGVVQLLDCKSRGALAAATRGAPVAPPRPAPEVVTDFRRLRRKLKLAEMTLLHVGLVLRENADPNQNSQGAIDEILTEHYEIMDEM